MEKDEESVGGQPDPLPLPDVATEPHPSTHAPPASPGDDTGAGEGRLREVLPEINEAARKVGGYKRLAEIAGEVGQAETGQ
jgi:hypothetical protein